MRTPVGAPAAGGNVRRFLAIWVANLVSLVGSALTGFVLGVWVYQETGSPTLFAITMIANVLPGILVAPFAGVATDRFDRRRLLILGDCGAALTTVVVAVLIGAGRLEIWHVYVATVVGASFNCLHGTSFSALVPMLIPKRHLGRANGLTQATMAAQIAAPLAAGTLLATVGLLGVVVIDLASAAVALTILFAVRLPGSVTRPDASETGAAGAAPPSAGGRAGGGAAAGWRHLARRPGLRVLMVVFGLFNLLFAMAGVLVQPLILSFSSPATLGVLMFAGGSGLFVGSLVMGAWGGPRRKTTGVLLFALLGGMFLMLHSLRPSALLIGVAAPLFLFTLPVVNGCTMTLLQAKTAATLLGRVMATSRMVAQGSMLLGYVAAGPLAGAVFEPLLQPGGALAGSAGRLVGVGPGRGIALMFLIVGLLLALVAVGGALQPRLRRLEDEVPDALPDTPPADEATSGQEPPAGADRAAAPAAP